MQTTLEWLKENILAHLTLSVTVANGQITVSLTDGTSYTAPCPNVKDAFTPVVTGTEAQSRGGGNSTDARLWGG